MSPVISATSLKTNTYTHSPYMPTYYTYIIHTFKQMDNTVPWGCIIAGIVYIFNRYASVGLCISRVSIASDREKRKRGREREI